MTKHSGLNFQNAQVLNIFGWLHQNEKLPSISENEGNLARFTLLLFFSKFLSFVMLTLEISWIFGKWFTVQIISLEIFLGTYCIIQPFCQTFQNPGDWEVPKFPPPSEWSWSSSILKPRPNDRNMPIATLLGAACGVRLATVLRHVGCFWLKFDQFQTWANNTQHVATHRNTVAKRTQHVAPNNVAMCCVGMLGSFGRGFMSPSGA